MTRFRFAAIALAAISSAACERAQPAPAVMPAQTRFVVIETQEFG